MRFFEEFNFKFLMKEIDETPKKDINPKESQLPMNEPFTLTPLGTKALNLLLNSPNNESEDLQRSIKHLTPFPTDKNVYTLSSANKRRENGFHVGSYSPIIESMLRGKNIKEKGIVDVEIDKENTGDYKNLTYKKEESLKCKNINFLNGYLKQQNPMLNNQSSTSVFESIKHDLDIKKDFYFNESVSDYSRKNSICSNSIENSENSQSIHMGGGRKKSILLRLKEGKLGNRRKRDNNIKGRIELRIGDYIWDKQEELMNRV